MSLRKIINNDDGLTYTLEAVLGAFLIIGTVMFMTTIAPHTAQKTGEYSKVQLVDIGRDALNLVELAPVRDIFSNYSRSQGVNRTYTLLANNQTSISVFIGDNINFTVYQLDNSSLFRGTLILEKAYLGSNSQTNWTTITGFVIKNITTPGEYSIMAVNSFSNPTEYSNSVTITVGYYFLNTDVNGIFANGDLNVNGTVYYPNWSGVPNLSIQILDNDGTTVKVNNATTTNNTGNFSFIWPNQDDSGKNIKSGIYFIRAKDTNGNYSNNHMIIYSGDNPGDAGTICCDSVIYETDSVNVILYPSSNTKNLKPVDQFYINKNRYSNNFDKTKITISDPPINPPNYTIVTLTAYTAGDYYIYYQGTGNPSTHTNSILIRVLPLQTTCILGDCKPKCAGLDMTSLSIYLRLFMPPYINYNLYLINPDGTICELCPKFKEIINGYPTDEAVTVNKILHIRTLNGEFLRELRIVLWYK